MQTPLRREDIRRMRSVLHSPRTDDCRLRKRGLSFGVDLDSGVNVTDAEHLHTCKRVTGRGY